MKKIISLVLIALIVFTAFASCGGRDKVDISKAKTIADLKGATIAAQADTFHLKALEQIEGITVKDYPDFTDLLVALQSGAIDGYVAEEPTALSVCAADSTLAYLPFVNNTTGFKATDAETGIAVAFKTGSALVAEANTVIATISTDTRNALMKQIVTLSEDPEANVGALALNSTKTDTSKGTLKIAMECAYKPFNWTQTTAANGAVAIEGKAGMYANGYDVRCKVHCRRARYEARDLSVRLGISHSRSSVGRY